MLELLVDDDHLFIPRRLHFPHVVARVALQQVQVLVVHLPAIQQVVVEMEVAHRQLLPGRYHLLPLSLILHPRT